MSALRGAPATGALSPTPSYLPLSEVDRATDATHKLRGLVDCIRSASLSADPPPDDAIASACWLARDLVDELEAIATMRQRQQPTQSAAGA